MALRSIHGGEKMKKLTAVLLVAVMVIGGLFAQGAAENASGMQRIIILNNAFDGLELSSQCYNAKEYHKAYSLGEIIDDNFWFTPAADAKADTVAFTDFYTDSTSVEELRQKYVSFVKDNPSFDYDLFVGKQQKETYDVKYKGYCIIDKEGLVFVPEDGWNAADLMTNIGMVKSDAYEFVSVSGEKAIVASDKLADCEIILHGNDCADLSGAATLEALLYIIPQGLTKESMPSEEGVSRLTVLLCANGVYKTEPKYSENRAGTYYDSWAVADLFKKFSITACNEVKVQAWTDGYSQNESYDLFVQKYISFQEPISSGKQKDFFTLGKVQARNSGVSNIGYIVLSNEAFAYIPSSGLALSEAFAKTGMDAAVYIFKYADKTEKTVRAEAAAAMVLPSDSNLSSIEIYL